MRGNLLTTHSGTMAINTAAGLVGILAATAIDTCCSGTTFFLCVTAAESGVFVVVYGFHSSWRREPAARAVFWAVLAYCGVSTHLATLYIWPRVYWWSDDLREALYLGLAIAGLNLVLTLIRVLAAK